MLRGTRHSFERDTHTLNLTKVTEPVSEVPHSAAKNAKATYARPGKARLPLDAENVEKGDVCIAKTNFKRANEENL